MVLLPSAAAVSTCSHKVCSPALNEPAASSGVTKSMFLTVIGNATEVYNEWSQVAHKAWWHGDSLP